MFSTEVSERNSCGEYSSFLFIIVHQVPVTFDIVIEDCCELERSNDNSGSEIGLLGRTQ
jgi:hypothetical protein